MELFAWDPSLAEILREIQIFRVDVSPPSSSRARFKGESSGELEDYASIEATLMDGGGRTRNKWTNGKEEIV